MWRWFGKVSVRCDKIDMTFPPPRQTPRNFKMKNSISSKYFHAKMLNSIIVLLPRKSQGQSEATVDGIDFCIFLPAIERCAFHWENNKKFDENERKILWFENQISSQQASEQKNPSISVPIWSNDSRSRTFESWYNISLILKFIFILFLPRYKAISYIEVKGI